MTPKQTMNAAGFAGGTRRHIGGANENSKGATMNKRIIILCLLTSTASPMTLQQLADGWGTKYNNTDLGKFAATYYTEEIWLPSGGGWIVLGPNDKVTRNITEKTGDIVVDGDWQGTYREIDIHIRIDYTPPLRRVKTIIEPIIIYPPPIDPAVIIAGMDRVIAEADPNDNMEEFIALRQRLIDEGLLDYKPPPPDPNAVMLKNKATILNDRERYGPWEKWQPLFN